MNFIVENEKLEIQYIPGNGAWTYQLIIPNTKNIKGKWGDLKVSGKIDNFEIKNKNLGPMKNSDKKMALNSEIRNSLGKGAGDLVNVTLYLEDRIHVQTNENEIQIALSEDFATGYEPRQVNWKVSSSFFSFFSCLFCLFAIFFDKFKKVKWPRAQKLR